jgi:hypothetical protein
MILTPDSPRGKNFTLSCFAGLGIGYSLASRDRTPLVLVVPLVATMAFLANRVVDRRQIRRPLVPYVLLLLSLAVGLVVARGGGFPSTPASSRPWSC